MASDVSFGGWAARPATAETDAPRPRKPSGGPVFLGDCATAADHTTLLVALWRRWEQDDKGE